MSKELKDKIMKNAWSFMAQAGQWGFAFLVFLFLLRVLEKDMLGQWIIYMSLITLVEALRNGFVQNGFIYFLKQENANEARLTGASAFIMIAISILSYAGLFFTAPILSQLLDSPQLTTLIIPAILYFMINGMNKLFELGWLARSDFKKIAAVRTSYGFSFLGITVACFLLGKMSLWILPFLQVASATIALTVSILIGKKLAWTRQCKNEINRLLNYGRYAAGTNLTSLVLNKADIFIIGGFLGPAAVSVYNTATRLINIMEIPLTSIAQYFYPQISESNSQQNKPKTQSLIAQALLFSMIILLPMVLGVFLLGKFVIILIAGPEYLGALVVLKILTAFIFVKAVGRITGISLDAIGLPHINFTILLLSLVINISLNLILISAFDIIGVALATAFTWILGSAIASIQLKKSSIDIIKSFRIEFDHMIGAITKSKKIKQNEIRIWH